MVAQNSPHRKLSFVFIGTIGDFSMRPLRHIARYHNIIGIVESAPRDSNATKLSLLRKANEVWYSLFGRPSLWLAAQGMKVPYFHFSRNNLGDLQTYLEKLKPELICVASMNQLLPNPILEIPPLGCINFHPSALPKYRGPNAWIWHYYNMEQHGGVTIHYLDDGEDTGDIIRQETFSIPIGMNPYQLMEKTIDLGTTLMLEVLDDIARQEIHPVPQHHLPCPFRGRYLKPGEDIFHWQDWSLEHTLHFLSGAFPWHNAIAQTPGLAKYLRWRALGNSDQQSVHKTGTVRLDVKGFYFAHPHGKIYLIPIIRWTNILLILVIILAILRLLII